MGMEETTAEVAKGAFDAYKTNPLMTGLLTLNLVFLVGFGWFLKGKNEQHEALVMRVLDEEKSFRDDLLQLAAACSAIPQKTSGKAGYFPLPGDN
jgi:hypothetical protein